MSRVPYWPSTGLFCGTNFRQFGLGVGNDYTKILRISLKVRLEEQVVVNDFSADFSIIELCIMLFVYIYIINLYVAHLKIILLNLYILRRMLTYHKTFKSYHVVYKQSTLGYNLALRFIYILQQQIIRQTVQMNNKRQFFTNAATDKTSPQNRQHRFSNVAGQTGTANTNTNINTNTNMNNMNASNMNKNIKQMEQRNRQIISNKNGESKVVDNGNNNGGFQERKDTRMNEQAWLSNNPKINMINNTNTMSRAGNNNSSMANPNITTNTNTNTSNLHSNQNKTNNTFTGRQQNRNMSPETVTYSAPSNANHNKNTHMQSQSSQYPYQSSASHQPQPNRSPIKVQQKCIICGTNTEKCCSLCRKVFYCSAQHQQVDWHMRHKFSCEGRTINNQVNTNANTNVNNQGYNTNSTNTNKFIFYSNNTQGDQARQKHNKNIQQEQYQKQLDYQAIHRFLQLLEQRLVMRAKIMNQISNVNQRTPAIVRESLVKQTQQLLHLSDRITKQEYKPSFSRKITKKDIMNYSSEQWGTQVVVSEAAVGLEYYADLVLMAKMYHMCGMTKDARELIISIGRMLEDPDQKNLFLLKADDEGKQGVIRRLNFTSISTSPAGHTTNAGQLYSSTNTAPPNANQQHSTILNSFQDPLTRTKNLILQSIIQVSELYNIDKTSQSAYKLYIKRIEIEQGIWQQIYAYFNIGVWYMKKTYYDKSVKSFLYSLQLLDSHKRNVSQSMIFKADCLYNVGQAYWVLGERVQAIQNMQECYRVRMNGIGKNSMECSYCLYRMAKWYKDMEKWNQCLQYLDQCHRIRKLYQNQPGFENQLEEIKILIAEVCQRIRRQKKKSNEKMEPRAEKYYEELLAKQKNQEERMQLKKYEQIQLLPKGSVASRLFRDDKEYVKFKVVISQQMWGTVSSDQAQYLPEIIQRSDQKLQKSEAIRLLMESKFVGSLTSPQRDIFFKQNQLDQ